MNIGQRMKQRRIELGLSAEKLGDILGKNRSTIYRYENGDIENMSIDMLEPIAAALHTTPAFLMGWDVEEIEAISSIQNDANTYDDAHEAELKELFVEFSKMNITAEELDFMKSIAASMTHESLSIFHKLYDLDLNIDELNDVFNYASFIKSKRK